MRFNHVEDEYMDTHDGPGLFVFLVKLIDQESLAG